jgi:osmotically-inducible protein OsmY
MTMRTSLYAAAFFPLLSAVVAGCATFDKCGFGGCPGDKEIAERIRAQLEMVPALSGDQIDVQTLDKIVYLSGLIEEPVAEDALAIARNTAGVKKVVDSFGPEP